MPRVREEGEGAEGRKQEDKAMAGLLGQVFRGVIVDPDSSPPEKWAHLWLFCEEPGCREVTVNSERTQPSKVAELRVEPQPAACIPVLAHHLQVGTAERLCALEPLSSQLPWAVHRAPVEECRPRSGSLIAADTVAARLCIKLTPTATFV